jgi:magnesium chelatase subunit D
MSMKTMSEASISDDARRDSATHFPFSAIVGQDAMKRALLFNAIDSSIGGVLITGTRGTAKSTAARAMAALLPEIEVIAGSAFNLAPSSEDEGQRIARVPTPFVNLPVGATEDRVLGTLDVERVLQSGERRFEPGLLARANRGVLYVDEVNLLPDHLVDVLLDSVAMGVNRVEREGVSFTHEARVILIGTMNPEEGELRPQLLDRFGLSVVVAGYFEPDTRREVVRRRIAFESDPQSYGEAWKEAETELSARIERARTMLQRVRVADEQLDAIVEACAEAKADGLRADIVAYKTARVIAAFDERTEVNAADVEEALALALAHRRRVAHTAPKRGGDGGTPPPPDSNGGQQRREQQNKQQGAPQRSASQQQSTPQSQSQTPEPQENESRSDETATDVEKVFAVGSGFNLSRMLTRRRRCQSVNAVVFGRGTFASSRGSGQFVRAVTPRRAERLDPAIEATIRAAALDAPAPKDGETSRIHVRPAHWRHKQRRIRTRNLILLVVDASGSMAAQQRMQAAKGAICSLLEDSYQKRDVVALVAFRGETAEELLPPTRSAVFAYRRLAELPTGGRTPLAEGLKRARYIIERQARKGERVRPFLVLVTDGRATVPEAGAFAAALREASNLRRMQVTGLCIDMETGRVRFGQARELARALDATYTHIQELPPREWGRVIQEWVAAEYQSGTAGAAGD